MDSQYPTPPQPSLANQAKASFLKCLPDWTAHIVSAFFHGLFVLTRELGRIIREAIGR